MKKPRYTKQVFWSEEDAGYIGIAPDLPGCSAFGSTVTEAFAQLELAIEAWLYACKSAGNPIPLTTKARQP